MGPFEYLLAFAAVVLGLSIVELAMGLNRLLRAEDVRWDWLAPFAALLVFLKIVAQWWSWHAAVRFAPTMTFEIYLALLASAAILFLLSATPLPEGADGADLRAHFARVSRRFWILFALHSASSIVVAIWVQAVANKSWHLGFSVVLLLPLVALGFGWARWRWAQALGLALFASLYVYQYFGRTLF